MEFKKYNKYILIIPFLFIVYPIIAIFPLFIELINKKKYAIFWIAIFFAMLGYITIPLYNDDLTRHYLSFDVISSYSLIELLYYIKMHPDFLLPLISFLFSKIGLSKQFLPFLSVFIGYYFTLKILYDSTKENESVSRFSYILIVLTFFFSINFRSLSIGLRNSTAIILYLFGTYEYLIRGNKKGFFYMFIAVFTHIMILPLLPLIFIAKKINITRIYRVIFIISFLLYFVNVQHFIIEVLGGFGSSLSPFFESKVRIYTEGYWGSEYLLDMSFKGRVFQNIGNFPIFLCLIYLFIFNDTSRYRNLVYLIGIIINSLYSFPNLFGRYGGVLTSTTLVLFLIEYYKYPQKKVMKKFLLTFLLIFALKFFSMLYTMRHTIIKSYPKMLYQTSVFVFNNEVNESDYIVK